MTNGVENVAHPSVQAALAPMPAVRDPLMYRAVADRPHLACEATRLPRSAGARRFVAKLRAQLAITGECQQWEDLGAPRGAAGLAATVLVVVVVGDAENRPRSLLHVV